MTGNAITITISAVDKASDRLEAINKRIAGMGAMAAKLDVTVTHANPPPGSSVKASSSSPNVNVGTLKIVNAMTGHA